MIKGREPYAGHKVQIQEWLGEIEKCMSFLEQESATCSIRIRRRRESNSRGNTGNPELRERARPLNRGGKIKLGETEMKLATPSSPAKEASLISQLYSGSRKPAGRS